MKYIVYLTCIDGWKESMTFDDIDSAEDSFDMFDDEDADMYTKVELVEVSDGQEKVIKSKDININNMTIRKPPKN